MSAKIILSVAVLALGLCTLDALAQSPEPTRDTKIEARFKAADKNKDGKLTLEEARNGMPRIADNFERIDTEKRGYITVEQIKKFVASL